MSDLVGRWDLLVTENSGVFPSWVELLEEGGQFVGRVGSARPIQTISLNGDAVTFSLPPQYEGRKDNLTFHGTLEEGILRGTTTLDDGTPTTWEGRPAPALPYYQPTFGEPIELIQTNLDNWTLRSPDWVNNWSIVDGALVNSAAGSDLITLDRFSDFKLIAEYSYPKDSNSGIYLRGRYEVQILDDYEGTPNGVGNSAAIYGFIAPSVNSIHPFGEWNTAEITLIGRFVTIVLNGTTVIDNQEIPGITGGALDSSEGEPGRIFVQGDHGPVTFRRLTIYPARS